jgi:cholesterol oxidase
MTLPTSIRFTEEMKGYVAFGEDDYVRGARGGRASSTRLMVHLTIEIPDLDRFAGDPRREARAAGWVQCDALGGRLPVERGAVNLLVEEDDASRRRMLYRIYFRDGVGHALTLVGFKAVGDRPGAHVWRETTTLYARILRGHVEERDDASAEVVASGIVRLRPSGFLRQLATFRTRGPGPAGRIAAVGRFDALFLGQLWHVYRRRIIRERGVPSNVRRKPERWKP